MRIETVTRKLYKFNELSEKAKQTALEKQYIFACEMGDVSFQSIEDAEQIGLKIVEYDIHYGTIKGNLELDAEDTANKIIANHGKICGTYKLAEQLLADRKAVPLDDDGEYSFADSAKVDDIDSEFERALSEEYLSMLRKDFEYQTSEECLTESIEANEYEFDESGNLA